MSQLNQGIQNSFIETRRVPLRIARYGQSQGKSAARENPCSSRADSNLQRIKPMGQTKPYIQALTIDALSFPRPGEGHRHFRAAFGTGKTRHTRNNNRHGRSLMARKPPLILVTRSVA